MATVLRKELGTQPDDIRVVRANQERFKPGAAHAATLNDSACQCFHVRRFGRPMSLTPVPDDRATTVPGGISQLVLHDLHGLVLACADVANSLGEQFTKIPLRHVLIAFSANLKGCLSLTRQSQISYARQ